MAKKIPTSFMDGPNYLVKDFFDFSSVVGESIGDGVPSEEHGAPLAANLLGPLRLLGLMAIRWRAAA